eukprot:30130-Pelagococcus_subviridis.AAC.6
MESRQSRCLQRPGHAHARGRERDDVHCRADANVRTGELDGLDLDVAVARDLQPGRARVRQRRQVLLERDVIFKRRRPGHRERPR